MTAMIFHLAWRPDPEEPEIEACLQAIGFTHPGTIFGLTGTASPETHAKALADLEAIGLPRLQDLRLAMLATPFADPAILPGGIPDGPSGQTGDTADDASDAAFFHIPGTPGAKRFWALPAEAEMLLHRPSGHFLVAARRMPGLAKFVLMEAPE